MFFVLILGLLIALLARVPEFWRTLGFGYEEPLRLILIIVVFLVWRWLRTLAIAALPRAPTLIFGYLSLRSGGQRHRLRARTIVDIDVVASPPDDLEFFIIELQDGKKHRLCPVTWRGAGPLYRRLRRSLPRSAKLR